MTAPPAGQRGSRAVPATAAPARLHNFGAGPGALPVPVLAAAREALCELPGAGATILEISHRSAHFERILAETEANLRALLGIDDAWAVLFLQGRRAAAVRP